MRILQSNLQILKALNEQTREAEDVDARITGTTDRNCAIAWRGAPWLLSESHASNGGREKMSLKLRKLYYNKDSSLQTDCTEGTSTRL